MRLEANSALGSAGPYPFGDARLKLERARFHFEELDEMAAWFVDDACGVTIGEERNDPGWTIVRLQMERPPPRMLGVVAGEISHSLRSALDLIAFQLVNAGRDSERNSFFPICIRRRDYWGPVKRGKPRREGGLQGVDPAFLEVIDRFQPFETRPNDPANDPLAMVNQFANRDKHRVVHPVVATPQQVGVSITARDPAFQGRVESIASPPGPVEAGSEIHRYRVLGGETPCTTRAHSPSR